MKGKATILVKIVSLIGLAFLLLPFEGEKHSLQAAEPIKIGAVLSITGWGAALGQPELEAITIEVEKINRQGGILGRPLEVYFEDDQTNPSNAAIAATKLIRDKKVCCILGGSLTVTSMAILPIVEREGILNVSIGAGHEITYPLRKWVFRIPATDIRLSPVILKFAANTLRARKIALLHGSDASGMMGAKGIEESVGKYDASIAIIEKFDPKDTNIVPQLTKIKAARPDAIILYGTTAPAVVIAKNYSQLGMEIPVLASHGIPNPEFIKLAAKSLEGKPWIFFSIKSIVADKLPPNDPWRVKIYDPVAKAIKEKYGKGFSPFHANGHDAIHVAINALKIAGTDDRAALRDAMEKVELQGLVADYKYSPTDHDGQDVDKAVVPMSLKNDEFWPYK
jgi:branched-chain amino acid transport system substrate-binding protein